MRLPTAAAASATTAASKRSRSPATATATPSRSTCLPLERFSSSLHKSAANTDRSPARAIVESVRPEVDCGRFPAKRALGDEVLVEADVFADGHDAVVALLLYKYSSDKDWKSVPMAFHGNDHWSASFKVEKLGRYEYPVRGWTDPFLTWQRDLVKRRDAGQDLSVDLLIGAGLASSPLKEVLSDAAKTQEERYAAAIAAAPAAPDASRVSTYERTLEVLVDPVRARFSSWYEMFPRSARGDGTHGTFRDLAARLPYIAE